MHKSCHIKLTSRSTLVPRPTTGVAEQERLIHEVDWMYLYRDRDAYDRDAFSWGLRAEHGFRWEEVAPPPPGFSDEYRLAVRVAGGHGRIADPEAYVQAIASHFEHSGGELRRSAAVAGLVRSDGGGIAGVRLVDGTTIACDACVLAAGVWTKALAAELGIDVPMESERGYHIDLWKPSWSPECPTLINDAKFNVTPMADRLRLAGVVEFASVDAPAAEPPFEFILRTATRAMPGLRWERMTRWQGHRPAPVDSIPILGEVEDVPGAFMAFGHHHVGLTGGAKTGRLVAEIVAYGVKHVSREIDLAPFTPSRFLSARASAT